MFKHNLFHDYITDQIKNENVAGVYIVFRSILIENVKYTENVKINNYLF